VPLRNRVLVCAAVGVLIASPRSHSCLYRSLTPRSSFPRRLSLVRRAKASSIALVSSMVASAVNRNPTSTSRSPSAPAGPTVPGPGGGRSEPTPFGPLNKGDVGYRFTDQPASLPTPPTAVPQFRVLINRRPSPPHATVRGPRYRTAGAANVRITAALLNAPCCYPRFTARAAGSPTAQARLTARQHPRPSPSSPRSEHVHPTRYPSTAAASLNVPTIRWAARLCAFDTMLAALNESSRTTRQLVSPTPHKNCARSPLTSLTTTGPLRGRVPELADPQAPSLVRLR